jgi:hypothetical protein
LWLLNLFFLAAPVAAQNCTADCDRDGTVTVDEIVTALNIGLGTRPVTDCTAGDSTNDGAITVDEIVAGLNFALNGCPAIPTPSPSPAATMRLDLGSGSGLPGAVVRIPLTLSASDGIAVALSTDITYDATHIRVVQADNVPCAIDPDIGPGTAFDQTLLAGILNPGPPAPLETIRIGVLSFTNTLPIPDGVVVTCDFRIMPAAPAQTITLHNRPDVSDVAGNLVPVSGSNGAVTVR